ncbi:MAG: 2-C-methyl-D-erythritol 4-phosphate cytidylyltransferase [Bacteroidia bacterium]
MSKHLIIVAGGTGTRMKSEIPKQLIALNGKAVIIHTLERFFSYDGQIQVVIASHKNYLPQLQALVNQYFPEKNICLCEGGDTRFHSVKNGLAHVKDSNGVVGIHDAARPLVSVETIRNCFETAAQKGNAVPVISLSESLRHIENNLSRAVNRSDYKIVQTPQCFKTGLIKTAFEQDYSSAFTDDATVAEQAGLKINLVEGNPENIKITTPADLVIANAFMEMERG